MSGSGTPMQSQHDEQDSETGDWFSAVHQERPPTFGFLGTLARRGGLGNSDTPCLSAATRATDGVGPNERYHTTIPARYRELGAASDDFHLEGIWGRTFRDSRIPTWMKESGTMIPHPPTSSMLW